MGLVITVQRNHPQENCWTAEEENNDEQAIHINLYKLTWTLGPNTLHWPHVCLLLKGTEALFSKAEDNSVWAASRLVSKTMCENHLVVQTHSTAEEISSSAAAATARSCRWMDHCSYPFSAEYCSLMNKLTDISLASCSFIIKAQASIAFLSNFHTPARGPIIFLL